MADIQPKRTPEEIAAYFTWQDVDGLRSLATSLANNLGPGISVAPLLDLADRIAGLLPPRAEN